MAPPPRAVRIVVTAIVAAVLSAVWLLAAAMFVTGLVLWRDWNALAREGVDHEARVKGCEWESMNGKRLSGSSGFYSCDYLYTVDGSGPEYSGHFQSPRDWKAGAPIAIRYQRDRPSASATIKDLEHPSLAPGALMLLPLVYAGWQLRAPLRRALGRRATRTPS